MSGTYRSVRMKPLFNFRNFLKGWGQLQNFKMVDGQLQDFQREVPEIEAEGTFLENLAIFRKFP